MILCFTISENEMMLMINASPVVLCYAEHVVIAHQLEAPMDSWYLSVMWHNFREWDVWQRWLWTASSWSLTIRMSNSPNSTCTSGNHFSRYVSMPFTHSWHGINQDLNSTGSRRISDSAPHHSHPASHRPDPPHQTRDLLSYKWYGFGGWKGQG